MTNKQHFTTLEAAQRLQRAPITLQKWRALGLGPHFFYQGRHVFYALADLKAFERHYAEQLIRERNINEILNFDKYTRCG